MKGRYFLVVMIWAGANLLLYRLWGSYTPACEPCLPNMECLPCISEKQEVIKGIAMVFDVGFLLWLVASAWKRRGKG